MGKCDLEVHKLPFPTHHDHGVSLSIHLEIIEWLHVKPHVTERTIICHSPKEKTTYPIYVKNMSSDSY